MIKTIYNFLFSIKGRMSRKHYFLLTAGGFLIVPLIFLLLLGLPNSPILIKIKMVMFFSLLPYCITYSICSKVATIKRFHDLGQGGENIWILSIPIKNISLGLSLLFDKGQKTDNEYGPTTWIQQEIDKDKPSSLKLKVNELTKKKSEKNR